MAPIRTFIAFDTPIEIKKEMSALQDQLKNSRADVKWESTDKFHATIKFLGGVEESILQKVIATTELIVKNYSQIEVIFQSLGCFPNKNRPRVIWIGCGNTDGTLLKLKQSMDKALLPYGFDIEDRTFHPHITLGRVKSLYGIKNLIPMLENLTFEPRKAIIHQILIMKSVLSSEGSKYTILKTIPLQQ